MAYEIQKVERKMIYIVRWTGLTERYVRYDSAKDDYLEVNLGDAQKFETEGEAKSFADKMADLGYDRPEIVPVEVKSIA